MKIFYYLSLSLIVFILGMALTFQFALMGLVTFDVVESISVTDWVHVIIIFINGVLVSSLNYFICTDRSEN